MAEDAKNSLDAIRELLELPDTLPRPDPVTLLYILELHTRIAELTYEVAKTKCDAHDEKIESITAQLELTKQHLANADEMRNRVLSLGRAMGLERKLSDTSETGEE